MTVNENTPVKCPDCKVWWRGLTHKCEKPVEKKKIPLEPDYSEETWVRRGKPQKQATEEDRQLWKRYGHVWVGRCTCEWCSANRNKY